MTTTDFSSRFLLLPDHLANFGFWTLDSVFDPATLEELNVGFNNHLEDLKPATIGHKSSKLLDEKLRSDSIYWIDENDSAILTYFSMIQMVTNVLKRELYLPIRRTETQMAMYNPGQFYTRHQDRHKASNQRLVSAVFYLNESWKKEDGGELIIYPSIKNLSITRQVVEPISNRLVIFLSELEHEVLETNRIRKSFTTWFREDL